MRPAPTIAGPAQVDINAAWRRRLSRDAMMSQADLGLPDVEGVS